MKKAVLAALAVVLTLSVAACGSDSKETPKLGAEEKKVAANISKTFSNESSGALTAKEADCFADGFVEKVGVKKLKAAKLINEKGELNQTGAKFDDEISGKFADAFLGCVDYQKRQAEEIAKADKKVDAVKLQACLEKEMPESYVKKLIVASQTQSADGAKLVEESTKKLSGCKTQATAK
ncbi:hypothetical protein [Marmoricola sp. RAF53]|uniref:hypothetical protein n=1 Tax=Marmoricola sp. RAF53 TaxID=3233059 RepID=UPI003F9835F0